MNSNAHRELERILAQKGMMKKDLAEKLGLMPTNLSAKLKAEAADSIFFSKCAEALELPSNYFLTFADDRAPYLIPLYLQIIEEKDKQIALLEETLQLYRSQRNQNQE